ncbi:MAG TPA: phosphate acyltransferase [Chthoniobacteraceae bacterium]|nr:phosphate acyltransferase [Chthoniobacteraceae bacterium]
MKFIETVYEKLRRHPKRIVFPEGTEPRVLHAAEQFVKLKLGAPILLGNRDEIKTLAEREKVNLHRIGIIDPAQSNELPLFSRWLRKLQRYRNLGEGEAEGFLLNPNYFGAMMIQHGQADAMVGGVSGYAGSLLRPLFQLVKPLPEVAFISSCMLMALKDERFGEKGVLFFADCAVIPEPDVQQLAQIGVQAGRLCAQLTGERPRVAFLSYSSKGSARSASTEKVAAAVGQAKKEAEKQEMEIEVDGELQADTALLPDLATLKAPGSLVAGRANVLIFPDLNAGNIAVKLVEHLAGAETYGQILLGLSKPCADLSRGASVETIVGAAAIVGLQAIEYRKLYPLDPREEDEELALFENRRG